VVSPLKVCPQCGAEYPANARFCEIDGTALRSASSDADMVGSIVAERYHILKKLGEGGMGQVYLAEHVKMGRKSALKVMHASMVKDVDAISRFNREAANASRISHPNVAAVYDFGETPDGLIFLAMEFVDGPPLTKLIEQSGALPPTRAADIARQTAEALALAHDMGIVHRDLKPDNIMIARTREGGDLVKVVDFGIAKAAGNAAQKVTKTGLVVGTPEYMSPEQLAGDSLDGRSDIYSLALVTFNMLTGQLPFPSDSAQESMIMRLTDKPKTLAEMRPAVAWPADVQQVMDKALERDVSQRYQTATEFGRDLYRAIERMPASMEAAVGTQMVDVPPTRVAPPSPPETPRTSIGGGQSAAGPARSGTVAVPAPSLAPAVTQTAAPPKRTGIFALVGIAAVIVAVIVVVPMMRNAGAKQIAGNSSTPPSSAAIDTTKSGTAPAAQSGNPAAQPRDTATISSSVDPAPKDTVAPSAGSGRASPADQLRGLIDDSHVAARGNRVLSEVKRLDPRLKSSEEVYLAATLRSNVAAAHADSVGACNEFKKVLPKLDAAERTRANEKMALVCPP
jgi:eukaryotic-like serine/threonine-protein kinase